jgi:hypothetical protein
MLQLARDLASHALPPGDDLALLKRMLDVYVEQQLRVRFAATDDRRPQHPTAEGSRHIPAAVKRAVYQRDRGRCAFVGENGRRCDSRAFLQFHHHDPHRAGGAPTESNLSLRCGPHNRLEEKLRFEGGRLVPGRVAGRRYGTGTCRPG